MSFTVYSRLSQLMSVERNFSKLLTMKWIKTKVCFALLKSSLLCLLEWFAEKYQSSNLTLMYRTNIPKFELYNSNILAHPGEASLSHFNYYICNFSNPFTANVRPI